MRVTILAAGLVAVLAACGTTATGSGDQSTPSSTTASSTAASGTTASSQDSVQPAVKVEITLQGKPGLGLLTATNAGSTPITVQGWPKLAFTNAAGEPAAIPVEQKLVPGEGPSITLEPGRTAFAGVKMEMDDSKSFALNEITAQLPGSAPAKVTLIGTDGRPVADPGKLKVSEVKVGTLQPAAQGVTVFD
ncbi:DUF4232 domain-containing protein [Lentzea sp. NPDC060358]|uniref:DUF4232 domain-containing protein n=1 Tax=Lentzea sp. NPDC060358 TaxID=3347103 RepID=UPI00366582AA